MKPWKYINRPLMHWTFYDGNLNVLETRTHFSSDGTVVPIPEGTAYLTRVVGAKPYPVVNGKMLRDQEAPDID